jgi:hypothetical protein
MKLRYAYKSCGEDIILIRHCEKTSGIVEPQLWLHTVPVVKVMSDFWQPVLTPNITPKSRAETIEVR